MVQLTSVAISLTNPLESRRRAFLRLLGLALVAPSFASCGLLEDSSYGIYTSACSIEVTRQNLEEGVDPDGRVNGRSLFHRAFEASGPVIESGDCVSVVELLIEFGADPYLTTNDGWTALDVKVWYNRETADVELIDWLLEETNLVCIPPVAGRPTVSSWSELAAQKGYPREVQTVLEAEELSCQ